MRKREFKKILFEHTDLFTIDGVPFARSGAEAQKLIDAGNCASFATTPRRAMLQANMDDKTRKLATRTLKRAEHKERRREPKATLRRRAVIAAAATVVLSYFTLVPQGRALAKSIYEFVVNFFENGIIVIENKGAPDDGSYGFSAEADVTPPPSIAPEDNNQEDRVVTTNYASIQEFVEEVGKNPVVLNNPEAKLVELRYNTGEPNGICALISVYNCHGIEFSITQEWGLTASSVYSTGTNEYFYKDFMDKQIICSVDSRKGSLDGLLFLDNSKIKFSTDNSPEAEALYDALELYQH